MSDLATHADVEDDITDAIDLSSPAELVALLSREIAAGLRGAALSGALEQINVDRVTLRLGQPVADFAAVAWQTEVDLTPGIGTGIIDVVEDENAIEPGSNIPKMIASLPVQAIDGVSQVWSGRFEQTGVVTVGDLAALDPDQVAALAEKFDSRRPLAFGARARGCAVALPSSPTLVAQAPTFGALIGVGPDVLRARFGLSRSQAAVIANSVSQLSASLDLQTLDRLRFEA